MKKAYYYIIIAVVAVVAVIFLLNRPDIPADIADDIISPSPSPSATASPTKVVAPKGSTKPTPGIIVQEIPRYETLAKSFDELNRRLALDENCTALVPSQVQYANNTEIMLDNTASAKARIISIGGQGYSLDAHGWILTTLHSDKLPARLPVYCGDMELGRLDLVAK